MFLLYVIFFLFFLLFHNLYFLSNKKPSIELNVFLNIPFFHICRPPYFLITGEVLTFVFTPKRTKLYPTFAVVTASVDLLYLMPQAGLPEEGK